MVNMWKMGVWCTLHFIDKKEEKQCPYHLARTAARFRPGNITGNTDEQLKLKESA